MLPDHQGHEQDQAKEFYTVAEIAVKLRVSIDTVRNYIGRKRNPLPAYLLGREYRIRPAEFEQWLQQQKNIQGE